MIQKLEITGIHTIVDEDIKEYVKKKIGGLDKYIPKKTKASAHMEVHLKETKPLKGGSFQCEATLYLPHQTIVIKETAVNMYAAIDIAEAKLKIQLKKYKDKHASPNLRRHLIGRFKRNN